jgi:hypothetical protein
MEMEMNVAKEILAQLGGNKFCAMTGAKQFVGTANELRFKLPGGGGFATSGINYVVVRLEASDTYTVEFYRVRAMKMTLVSKHQDVYNDALQSVFTMATGLYTNLGKIVINGGQLSA